MLAGLRIHTHHFPGERIKDQKSNRLDGSIEPPSETCQVPIAPVRPNWGGLRGRSE